MPTLSVSRQARLGIMAGVLATAGAAAMFSLGTANAATDPNATDPTPGRTAETALVNFANTKINSVQLYKKNENGSWSGLCVKRNPQGGDHDTTFNTNSILIRSFVTGDCSGDELHSDTVENPPNSTTRWVIPLESLDDDDSTPWTA